MSSSELSLAAGQLRHAWLSSVSFDENDVFEFDYTKITYVVNHAFNTHVIEPEPKAEKSYALLELAASIEWKAVSEAEVESPFDLQLAVSGMFEWNPRLHERDLVEAWLEWNGVYLLWPYLRSYISLVTGASSLPPLTIYTMRVPSAPL